MCSLNDTFQKQPSHKMGKQSAKLRCLLTDKLTDRQIDREAGEDIAQSISQAHAD